MADGTTLQVFRTRGLAWRSARLRRFYAVLDEQDRVDKGLKPKRGVGRRIRREGPPKDGILLPPHGVARWMVSQAWLREMEEMCPDLTDVLRQLIVDPVEPEPELARLMLGPEGSEDEMVQQQQQQLLLQQQQQTQQQPQLPMNVYAHVSDTSYSLYNALQPIDEYGAASHLSYFAS